MNKKTSEKGITLVALIMTIIIMLILVVVTFNYSKNEIDKTRLESLKTNMLLIKAKSKTIYERYSFKEIDELPGIEYNPSGSISGDYVISQELKTEISKNEGTFYILEKEDLENMGLGTIEVDNEEFYIVDYESGEVFYAPGYTQDETTYYRLTDIQELK